jgi:hypothetical protein
MGANLGKHTATKPSPMDKDEERGVYPRVYPFIHDKLLFLGGKARVLAKKR